MSWCPCLSVHVSVCQGGGREVRAAGGGPARTAAPARCRTDTRGRDHVCPRRRATSHHRQAQQVKQL